MPPRSASTALDRNAASEHVAQAQVQPVFGAVSAIALHIRLQHDLRMDVEVDAHGADPLEIVWVLDYAERGIVLLTDVDAFHPNEGRDIQIAAVVHMVGGLPV